MSFTTWHNYGYGLRTDNITIKSVEDLAELLRLAPEFEKEMQLYFEDCDIEEPEIDDYFEFQEYDNHGLASLMKMVLKETEQVEFTDCGDYDGLQYLMYQPSYPWELSERDLKLTEEKLEKMLKKYFSVITDDEITPGYIEAEDGDL